MRRDEVPQDDHPFYEGLRRACYAVDEEGHYTIATSSGWEVERLATSQAMSDLDDRLERTRRAVLSGAKSPLAYHMESRQMTPALLAKTARVARWRVRRHLRPAAFAALGPALLARYAAALDLTPEALAAVPREARAVFCRDWDQGRG